MKILLKDLKKSLKFCLNGVENHAPIGKQYLMGVYIELKKNQARFIGTNGHLLYEVKTHIVDVEKNHGFIIMKQDIEQLLKALNSCKKAKDFEPVNIEIEGEKVKFNFLEFNFEFGTDKKPDFVNYDRIIDQVKDLEGKQGNIGWYSANYLAEIFKAIKIFSDNKFPCATIFAEDDRSPALIKENDNKQARVILMPVKV